MKMIPLPPQKDQKVYEGDIPPSSKMPGEESHRILGRRVRTPKSQHDSPTLHPKVDTSCDLLNSPAHCQTHQFLHENMQQDVRGCYRCIMMYHGGSWAKAGAAPGTTFGVDLG